MRTPDIVSRQADAENRQKGSEFQLPIATFGGPARGDGCKKQRAEERCSVDRPIGRKCRYRDHAEAGHRENLLEHDEIAQVDRSIGLQHEIDNKSDDVCSYPEAVSQHLPKRCSDPGPRCPGMCREVADRHKCAERDCRGHAALEIPRQPGSAGNTQDKRPSIRRSPLEPHSQQEAKHGKEKAERKVLQDGIDIVVAQVESRGHDEAQGAPNKIRGCLTMAAAKAIEAHNAAISRTAKTTVGTVIVHRGARNSP